MISRSVGQVMRVVAEGRIRIHHTIVVKACRPHTEPPFKIVLYTQYNGSNVPIIAVVILECRPMACTTGKPAGLIAKGVGLRGKRPQRAVAHGHPIRIAAEFGAGGGILEVILAAMFGHVCPLYKRVEERIVHVFTEALPAVAPAFQEIELLPRTDRF